MRHIDEIVIHCTATNPSWYADKSAQDVAQEIRRWHTQERKWSDIGYHFIVHRNGEVATGRPVSRSGAHVAGHNKNTIGVSLVGGRGGCSDDSFLDNFTEEQEKALRELIEDLKKDHKTITKVTGHNDYASKACPCFDVDEWY
jgi:N-acetyl-anhydromuramyl-L-alanine amidase AmpD